MAVSVYSGAVSEEHGQNPGRPPEGALRKLAMDESKRSFLRMVSHELRTPLNSIIGFSEIISRELYGPVSEPRYKEHAEIIRDSGLKLLRMVNQIMEIIRLEGGAAEFDLHSEGVEAAVEEVFKSLRSEADLRGVQLRFEAPHPFLVLADGRALDTILTNLLQNAIAFSPEGGEVLVSAHAREGAVFIDIRDQGQGVPQNDIARLLRPFEQGENALTRRGEGAGLGLPIVRLLCDAMAGGLRLRSTPGEGLTATVRLPAANPAELVRPA